MLSANIFALMKGVEGSSLQCLGVFVKGLDVIQCATETVADLSETNCRLIHSYKQSGTKQTEQFTVKISMTNAHHMAK